MNKSYATAKQLNQWLAGHFNLSPEQVIYVRFFILLIILAIVCCIVWWLTKKIVVAAIHKILLRTKITWDDVLVRKRFFDKLAAIVPAMIIAFSASYIFADFPRVIPYITGIADILIIGVVIWSVIALLSVFDDILSVAPAFKEKPISSYIQVVKIIVYFIGAILILSRLLGKSPLYFLGAMGAMTAVLLLIFKDTILGFVASIQISVYDMVRVGDWIGMPNYDTDGDVLSINLNTVKIQNWDKTITTVPTYAFITGSFKNWRGMSESGGRRIKRAIYLKMSSFRFCDEAMLKKFKQYRLLKDYITTKENEINEYNKALADEGAAAVNIRRLTNIGVFRIYAEKYLQENPNINHNMTAMVRQLDPTPKGLPLEVYCFSADQRWLYYENIMGDIFDHLLTVASEFQLEIFEEPTGKDFSHFREALIKE